ncbi:hypothetical protein SAY87_029902 [Trapa incisa]|uniref:Uncharacterized protein n=1 Tax=Trapa incisa TaxID=236973 RepID=A0AAN7Q9P8_9MYRT|nr:hypothetical protein SAY87_029902 [Trapa incisa]
MGTKFEYAVNLLANSPVSSSERRTFSFNALDDCQNPLNGDPRSEERGIHSFRQEEQGEEKKMGRNEEIQDKESIKKTMVMHENVFRQQAIASGFPKRICTSAQLNACFMDSRNRG